MNPDNFNIKTAYTLVNLCVESYKSIDDYNLMPFGLEIVRILNNPKSDIQGFIAKDKNDYMYIAFRGANTSTDYFRDLNFLHASFPEKKRRFFRRPSVHAGFYKGYISVKDQIISELSSHDYKRVFVTGHSMGAALAVLCALDIRITNNKSFVSLYTFGCPEIGNGPFHGLFKKYMKQDGRLQSFRIVNDEDIVPKINILTLGHVDRMVFIDGDGRLNLNPGKLDIVKEMIDDVFTVLTGEAISDHLSRNYLEVIKKLQK